MAKANTANRKRPDPVATPSRDAILSHQAAEIWMGLFPVAEDTTLEDKGKLHEKASDEVTILIGKLRKLRDDNKPVLRQRATNDGVLAGAIGKGLSDLQAAFVKLEVGEGLIERVALPRLKAITETPAHPFHEAANAFMKANKVKFVERDKTEDQKGKAGTILVSTRPQQAKAA